MNQDFGKLYQLIQEKYAIQSVCMPERTSSSIYLEELPKELAEIKEEVKPNNIIHLQDELADGFWDLFGLIEALKQEGMIDGIEQILKHAVDKYSQRVAMCDTPGGRKQVKEKQKIELVQKHQARYGI